ncbi:MAG: PAS domain S-box protein [bacterium]|nr:PAS domain S-box protein [bacterium]
MEQEPLQIGKRILKQALAPSRGILLLILAPLLLFTGALGVFALAYWLPRTEFVSLTTLAMGALALATAAIVSALIFIIMPSYLRFAKKGEEALAAVATGKERYVNALIGASLGFWEYDLVSGEAFFSARMMSMLGYPDRDKLDRMAFWYESIHPDDAEGVKRAMEYYLDGRTPEYAIEYRLRRANSEYIWVTDRGKVLRLPDGKPLKFSGIVEDLSNVKRVQEVLEARTNELELAKNQIEEEVQNVRKFQKAVDSSTEAVSITKPDGTIVYVNPAWTQLNGYTNLEAMGRNPRMLKGPEPKPEVFTAMWEKIAAGLPFHTEDIVNKRKDGTTYLAELSIFPISEGEQTLFYVSLCQDISLRKEIDRAKTEFVSLASHQLRTPLSAIRWYSEMLLSKYVGELNDKQKQYVKEIYAGNLRMVALVNALLNVSRLDLGTFAIEPEEMSLTEVCDSVLSELAPQLTEKNQTVERVFTNAPATYRGDPKLIRIIFQNFLSNSVKYTQAGGHIAVEISTNQNMLYIRVTDNGYGIPKSQHAQMFQKLFRADNVRQKDTEGTGLGMYIVKAIVESSGGQLSFESEENHGTTFHVLLPLVGMPKKTGTRGLT